MKNPYRAYLLLLFGLFLALPGASQTYNSRYMTTRDGLASGYIRQIYQDSLGFIWIATNNGLSKYDGYNFTNYRNDPDDSLSVAGSYIWEIQPAGIGKYFVVTSGGVNLFDPATEVFEKIELPAGIPSFEDGTADIDLTNKGDAWVTGRRGLYFIPHPGIKATNKIEFYPYYQDTARIAGTPALTIDENREAIWLDVDQSLRQFDLSTKTFKILDNLADPVNKLVKSEIWYMHLTQDGTLLASALEGLLKWAPDQEQPEIVDVFKEYLMQPADEPAFQSIWEDEEGDIYLGTGRSGGFIWDMESNEFKHFDYKPEVSGVMASNDVHFFFQDRDNNYWFGHHDRGLSLLYSNSWDYEYVKPFPDKPDNDPLNLLNDILDLGNGNLLFSSDGGLIVQPEKGEPRVYTPNIGSRNVYFELIPVGNKAMVTIAPSSTALPEPEVPILFDPATGEFEPLPIPDSLNIISYSMDQKEQVIFGTFTASLVSLDKKDFSWETINTDLISADKLPGSTVITIMDADSDDNWIAISLQFADAETKYNFYLYDKERKILEKVQVTNPENLVQFGRPTISHVREGVMYAYVGSGIMRQEIFADRTDILFEQYAGILTEGSRFIVEDQKGFLWMSNLSGLMRLDPVTEAVTFFEWSGMDRLSPRSVGKLAANGDIYWLGEGGYVRFNPDSLEKFDPISRVYVAEVRSTEQVYPMMYKKDRLVFSSAENNLSFSCLAMNYQDPLATQYRYRIVGYDNQWVNIESQRRVFLANMPPGKYEFQLQAAGKNGGFSEAMGTVSFEILPPWYLTWWAYAGYGLLFIFGATGLHRFQKSRTIRREREKTREKELAQAREIEKAYNELKTTQQQLIHSEKMASLGELTAGIAHEIQNPLNFVNNFSDVNSELVVELKEALKKGDLEEVGEIVNDISENEKKIVHHGKRAEEIVKSMLQHSRGAEGKKELTNLNALADEYLRLAFHGMRAKDKTFNSEMETDFDANIGEVQIVPQDIGRVLLNLITNAFHALHQRKQAETNDYQPKVTIQTLQKDGQVEIRVKDNGSGIPESIRTKIFEPFFSTKGTGKGTGLGLSLSYDIITKGHNGQIRVESLEGEGTEFIVTLPNT